MDVSEKMHAFLAEESFAVAGASGNRAKYGNRVLRALVQAGNQPVGFSLAMTSPDLTSGPALQAAQFGQVFAQPARVFNQFTGRERGEARAVAAGKAQRVNNSARIRREVRAWLDQKSNLAPNTGSMSLRSPTNDPSSDTSQREPSNVAEIAPECRGLRSSGNPTSLLIGSKASSRCELRNV